MILSLQDGEENETVSVFRSPYSNVEKVFQEGKEKEKEKEQKSSLIPVLLRGKFIWHEIYHKMDRHNLETDQQYSKRLIDLPTANLSELN